MAAETEGIALLSMYNDDDDDDEEEEEEEEEDEEGPAPAQALEEHERGGADEDGAATSKDSSGDAPAPEPPVHDATPPPWHARSPVLSEEESDYKTPRSPVSQTPPPPPPPSAQSLTPLAYSLHARSPTPPPFVPSPASVRESLDASRVKRASLTIVDYGHDDVAMSPDHEEGEIVSSGRVVVSMELQVSDGNLEDRTPPGNVQILTPSTQPAPSQPADFPEQSKSETSTAMDFTGAEPDVGHVEASAMEYVEIQIDVDPLSNFLPQPVKTKCPEELQEKINKFLAYKRAGKSFNADLRNRKDYRNPDFLQHAVRYQDIDQIGTCFNKDVFDPHGYDKSDYYDEIEADMKRELERKEQERKKSQKVDFVSGGTQPGIVAPALKISTQISVTSVSAAATSILPVTSTVDAMARDIRQQKKSKWDKIDGEVKNPLPSGGHDNLSTVGVHAAHLSAANAGAGYTAFAQQKRKEAEEKKSSERKFEKRS